MKLQKRILSPKKLLNSKWTAITPSNKEKHFIVTKLIWSEAPIQVIEMIELGAVHSKRMQLLLRQQLKDVSLFTQGWR